MNKNVHSQFLGLYTYVIFLYVFIHTFKVSEIFIKVLPVYSKKNKVSVPDSIPNEWRTGRQVQIDRQ